MWLGLQSMLCIRHRRSSIKSIVHNRFVLYFARSPHFSWCSSIHSNRFVLWFAHLLVLPCLFSPCVYDVEIDVQQNRRSTEKMWWSASRYVMIGCIESVGWRRLSVCPSQLWALWQIGLLCLFLKLALSTSSDTIGDANRLVFWYNFAIWQFSLNATIRSVACWSQRSKRSHPFKKRFTTVCVCLQNEGIVCLFTFEWVWPAAIQRRHL